MEIVYYCAVIAMCINVGNCFTNTPSEVPSQERFNYFDTELIQVLDQRKESNWLVSPVSIKFILGMLMEGVGGKSAEEIQTALRLFDDQEASRNIFDTWLSSLQMKGSRNSLKLANQVFLSEQCSITVDYSKTLEKHYAAGTTSVKFEDTKKASDTIVKWIRNQTSHLISAFADDIQIDPNTKMLLTSAVYFKGVWTTPFAIDRNAVRCFYSENNKCKNSVMMTQTGFFDYGFISRLNAEAIRLPYEGDKLFMLILLPKKRHGLQQLTRDLLHVSLQSIRSELKNEEVFVQIPKFEISYTADLKDKLKKLQISEVFSRNLNFSKIIKVDSKQPSVDHVFHSTKITVNEEGSEAAAITSAFFVPLMGGTTTSFIANHPFLFFVMESTRSSILFAGKYSLPTETALSSAEIHNPSNKNIFSVENSEKSSLPNNAFSGSFKKQIRPNQRRLSAKPKLRSIKGTFPISSHHSLVPNDKRNSSHTVEQTKNAIMFPSLRQTFYPLNREPTFNPFTPSPGFERNNKRGEIQILKPRKRQELLNDEWRHRALYFQ